MRTNWWAGLVVVLAGCHAMPSVAPQPLAPAASRAQWAGQDAPRLVRQLVLAAFDRADANHDRFLDATEWDRAEIGSFDLDKDGRVTSLEWASAHPIGPLTTAWQAAATDYFAHLDTDKNGWLARAELKYLANVPGLAAPSDLLFDRYSALNAGGLSPKVFTDVVLQVAYDAGRFKPMMAPPAWPTGDNGKPPAVTPPAPPAGAPATLYPNTVKSQSAGRR